MERLARSPPIVGLALASGLGATLTHLSVLPTRTLPPFLILFLLIWAFLRPRGRHLPLALAFLSGSALTHAWAATLPRDCRFQLREDQSLDLTGRLVGPVVEGRGELLPVAPRPGPCPAGLRVVVPGWKGEAWGAGTLLAVRGSWKRNLTPGRVPALRAGYLRVDSIQDDGHEGGGGPPTAMKGGWRLRDRRVLLGGWIQSRLESLFPRTAALAVALTWARKDGLAPEIRESFARAGVAHLLAISGFHVGVLAGLLLLSLGLLGLPPPLRALLSSVGVWVYAGAIGMPDAAFRASLLLSILAAGRACNRAVAPVGALATAFLVLLAIDPGGLLRPGFQLSFAGTWGLVVGYRPISRWIPGRAGRGVSRYLAQGIAAGLAATLATLPVVAWHFGRISLIGIPVTLLATPLVALALPGILLTLLLALVHLKLAVFLASGVEVVLGALLRLVEVSAALPFASVWVSRTTVVSGSLALGLGVLFLTLGVRVGGGGRRRFLAGATAVGIVMGPALARLPELGSVELVVLDVGQGDAALLRSPRGRWVLIDAGPRTRTFDAGARTVLPYLRRRGVDALELLILTHPDMDHVGGAAAIIRDFPVEGVLDPGRPAGSEVFIGALEAAMEHAVPWRSAEAGDSLNLDGMALRVLAPDGRERGREEGGEGGNNGASIVIEVRFGAFSALLTGDAPTLSEDRFVSRVLSPRIQVLKVGHHGSSTSTSAQLLERTSPEVALISVGRRNRFGHPDRSVLARLRAGGASSFRTDLAGNLAVRARRDGSYSVTTQHD